MISPSNAVANATGISIFVILSLIPRASREIGFHCETSSNLIKLFGTDGVYSISFVTTGKPYQIAPAPHATVISSNGPNALTNALILSNVYF